MADELTNYFSVLVFVDQLDMSVEETPHLVAELGVYAACTAAVATVRCRVSRMNFGQ